MRWSLPAAGLMAAAGLAGALAYASVTTEREFVRLVAEGDQAAAAGDRFRALEAYSGSLALVPDAVAPYLKRGRIYYAEGESEAALRDFRRAAELDPSAVRPLEWLGDISLELGRSERAADYFSRALAIDERAARLAYKLGMAEYRAGRAERAVRALETALQLDGQMADAQFLLGLCQRDTGQWSAARDTLEAVVRRHPAAPGPREALVEVYAHLGERQRMLDQLEALSTLDPDQPERLVAVGRAHALAGRDSQAVAVLSRAVERFPDAPEAYAALGHLWLSQARRRSDRVALAKAIEALTEATAYGSVSSGALADLGRAWLMAGDPGAAEQALRQALTRLPAEPDAFLDLAGLAERQGRLLEARDALLQYLVLTDDGRSVAGLARRIANLSLRLGEPHRALEWLDRARSEEGPSAPLLAEVASAALAGADYQRAGEAITEGLRLSPSDLRLRALERRLAASRDSGGGRTRPPRPSLSPGTQPG